MTTINTEGRTVREVLQELNARLKQEQLNPDHFEYGWDDMTWTDAPRNADGRRATTPWPERARWIVVYPVSGANEGYYIHLDAIYQPSTLFSAEFEKARAKDARIFQLSDSHADRRYTLGLAKVWDMETAWKIARATGDFLGV